MRDNRDTENLAYFEEKTQSQPKKYLHLNSVQPQRILPDAPQ
jgi:hypothetical protein